MPKSNKDRYPELEHGRWECNDQPSVETVYKVLNLLPIEFITMPRHDILCIQFHRPLHFHEASILGRLNPDDPPEGVIYDGETYVRLWWD